MPLPMRKAVSRIGTADVETGRTTAGVGGGNGAVVADGVSGVGVADAIDDADADTDELAAGEGVNAGLGMGTAELDGEGVPQPASRRATVTRAGSERRPRMAYSSGTPRAPQLLMRRSAGGRCHARGECHEAASGRSMHVPSEESGAPGAEPGAGSSVT